MGAKSAALDDAALTEREPSCASPSPSRSPRSPRRLQHQQQRNVRREKATYQVAAIAASSFVVASAVVATYLRISQHLDDTHPFPYVDLLSTCLLAVGGMVGMEMYARVVHRWAWHEFVPGWSIHRSHHEPRTGAFELNDLYAIVRIELDRRAPRLDGSALALLCSCALVLLRSCALTRATCCCVRSFVRQVNAVPAIGLTGYGFVREDWVGGVCFGVGLGITLFGMAYMFVHDGLVHKRFPVGPVKDVPGLRRIAVAHRMHHMDAYGGFPYGMFLGPSELVEAGFGGELERLVAVEVAKDLEREKRRKGELTTDDR